MNSVPLLGHTIAIPETRELDRLCELLEGLGATTYRCPLVAILDAPDPVPVDAWIDRLCAGGFDDLVFLTGEGLRRLLARAERIGRRDEMVRAIGQARTITRGPKPARALKDIGLSPTLAARVPTSRGVADVLAEGSLKGRRVGVQLYGSEPNEELIAALRAAGAEVATVSPYIYAPAADESRVLDLVSAMGAGRISAIAFTSASQVDRLFDVVERHAQADTLRAVLSSIEVAAVGPVVAEALADRGVRVTIGLDHGFVMKNLCNAIAAALSPRG